MAYEVTLRGCFSAKTLFGYPPNVTLISTTQLYEAFVLTTDTEARSQHNQSWGDRVNVPSLESEWQPLRLAT
jgi:hypothetical protein